MLTYRREIDGLRALAVMSVIFFHAGFNLFKGGYVGVDVFFVISGFLITSIILNEVENNNFSILNFYERRARRILPALFFVMIISIPVAWLVLQAKDLESFFKSLNAIPTFTANVFFWKDVDYFATASELKPLIHTWSLAVEEQYYIIFPFIFLVLGKIHKVNKKKIILILLLCLAISSLIYSHFLSSKNPSKNFFLLPTRFWEISIGGFIAFLPPNIFKFKNSLKQFFSLSGFLLILSSIFFFNKDTAVPSFIVLIPTMGTVLIIMYASADTIVGRLLSYKLFVWIGLVSYSAYLWHQPLFAFSRYYTGQNNLGLISVVSLIFLSFILAWLTWRFVELPFKNKLRFNRSFIFSRSISISLFFVVFGFGASKVFNDYGADKNAAFLLKDHSSVYFTGIRNEAIFMESLINAQMVSPDIVVIGSSRIMQIRSPDKRKLLNLGVSGSALRDDIGMIYLVDKKLTPSTVFIGVDPWLLSSQVVDGRYQSLENAYLKTIGKAPKEEKVVSKFMPLKNQLRDFYNRTTYSMKIPENDQPEIKAKKRSDGSHIYDTVYVSKTQNDIERGFNDLIKYKVLGNYSDNNEYIEREKAKNDFINLIMQQKRKRNVVLILSPYHPKLFLRMKQEVPYILEIEKTFKEIAKLTGVKIIGSYNPITCGCTFEDFYDGMHPKESCMNKILLNQKI